MKLCDLCEKALPPEVYDVWKKHGIEDALPIQTAAVEAGIFAGKSLLVVAPTSSGKTFLGEMLAFHKAALGKRAIYLVPFKAIAEERHAEFAARYRDHADLGFRCVVSDRDHHESDADLLNGKYDVAILTYEKLTALLVANQTLVSICGCVIIDEVQMISDENRGPGLELLLTTLRRLDPPCQLLALSAVLGKLNQFDTWLGAQLIREERRPVELRVGIVGPDGHFEFREANSGKSSSETLSPGSMVHLVADLVKRDEQVLLFVNSVRRTTELAQSIANALHMPAATDATRLLTDEADTETRELCSP
jgi:replicative superfamily II helicase